MARVSDFRELVFSSLIQSVVFLAVLTISLVMFKNQITSGIMDSIQNKYEEESKASQKRRQQQQLQQDAQKRQQQQQDPQISQPNVEITPDNLMI